MADRVADGDHVIVEKDSNYADRSMSSITIVAGLILIFLLLGALFGWFDFGGNSDVNETNTPIQQDTQVEVPNPANNSPSSGSDGTTGGTNGAQ